MNKLGLSTTELRAYHRTLGLSRPTGVRVQILDRNERNPRTIADVGFAGSIVLEGQINVDATAAVSRSLSLTLLDPDNKIHLDPSSASPAALFPDKFVAVTRREWVEELGRWISAPVFWGPISRFERRSNVVTLEAQGKESLNLEPAVMWEGLTYRKGTLTISALRSILYANGERRFSLPESRARIPNALSLGPHDSAWLAAKRLARSIDRQLFYDGLGRAVVRAAPRNPVFTFYAREITSKPAPVVLSDPQIVYEFGDVRNTIEVLGPEPKKGQRRIRYVATPARSDPLSPWSLGRNGEPRFLVETIDNDKIKRVADAKAIATRALADRLKIGVSISFESLVVPHLEENDLVSLVSELGTHTFRLQQFTIPLGAAGRMSIGSLKRSRARRRR